MNTKCLQLEGVEGTVVLNVENSNHQWTEEKVRNICLANRRDIIRKFKDQLLRHLVVFNKGLVEVAIGVVDIVESAIDYSGGEKDINEPSGEQDIRSIAYRSGRKALTSPLKFDSEPERLFVLSCENPLKYCVG